MKNPSLHLLPEWWVTAFREWLQDGAAAGLSCSSWCFQFLLVGGFSGRRNRINSSANGHGKTVYLNVSLSELLLKSKV